jgi:hypothetical protein
VLTLLSLWVDAAAHLGVATWFFGAAEGK